MVSAASSKDWILSRLSAQRGNIAIGFACSAGVAGMSGLVALLISWFMDAVSPKHMAPHIFAHVSETREIDVISVSLVVVYAVRWIFTYGQAVAFAEAGQRLGLGLRNEVYGHLQTLPLSFFNNQRTGALMSTINNDVPLMQSLVSGLKDIAVAPFYVVGGLILVFRISVPLTLAAVFTVPLLILAINVFTKRIRLMTANTQDKLSDVNVIMEETLSGIRIIQSFSAEKLSVDHFTRENFAAKDLAMRVVRQTAKLKPTTDLIGAMGIAFALWVAGGLVVHGHLTVGSLAKFLYVLNLIAVGVTGLGSGKGAWEQLMAGANRVTENVLMVKSDLIERADAKQLISVEGRVEFHDVVFGYKKDAPVLNGVTFTMKPGEVVAIVGHSGAGKSTLADLIPRFYDPVNGTVMIDGNDVRDVTLSSLRQHIGIVPQETVLFGGSIRDNIAYGDPTASFERIVQAATAANAHAFITDPSVMPDGYDTRVGERGKQLSGGQRQRIAIARALLKNPKILILDEATSSLDAASEILVQQALDELMVSRTTLVIAHRLSTIVNADRIIVMDGGRIAESGVHSELLRHPNGLYASLYENQFRRQDIALQPLA